MTSIHESRLAELTHRIAAIDAEVLALDDTYASVAGQFETGNNAHALKQAEQIEHKVSALKREKALALAAQARLERAQQDQQAQADQDERNRQLQQAREIADALCASHVEIDRILVTLRGQLERRASLLGQLQRSEVVDAGALVNRLSLRAVVTRSFCSAGLHRFAELQTVAPNSMVPLASCNSVLLGIGRPAAPPAADDPGPLEAEASADAMPRRRLFRATSNGGTEP
jgi:hypothetical protein